MEWSLDKKSVLEQFTHEVATACDLDPASLTADTRIKEGLNLTSMQRMIITGVVENLTGFRLRTARSVM